MYAPTKKLGQLACRKSDTTSYLGHPLVALDISKQSRDDGAHILPDQMSLLSAIPADVPWYLGSGRFPLSYRFYDVQTLPSHNYDEFHKDNLRYHIASAVIILTGNASQLETNISSIQELENEWQRLHKEFDRVYATRTLALIHQHEVQPKIKTSFVSRQTCLRNRMCKPCSQ